jgi:hypothetical protein
MYMYMYMYHAYGYMFMYKLYACLLYTYSQFLNIDYRYSVGLLASSFVSVPLALRSVRWETTDG